MFQVANSLIRYWESEFKVLRPTKNARGERKYTKKDIEIIAQIYTLLKERGFTIEGANKELMLQKQSSKEKKLDTPKIENTDGTEHAEQIVERLTTLRSRLLQIKNQIQKMG